LAADGLIGINLIGKTRQAAAHGHRLWVHNLLPLVELVGTIFEISPSDGAEIWSLIKAAQSQIVMGAGNFDRLLFEQTDHTDIVKLRLQVLDAAKNDAELAETVFLCLRYDHGGWLMEVIQNDLDQSSAGGIARGLTLAGLLDCTDQADLLWKNDIEQRPLVDTHGLTPVALAEEVCIYLEGCMPSNSL
jgi:hypothetical protein